MATDATGSPTPLGIPKFSTAADAPSGLGSNAQMDAIDTLLAARVVKPAGIVTGEATIWNGSSWDRSSVTRLGATSLVAAGYGTALPGSPYDGQEYVLVDSTTLPTYQWRFRYNAGSSNTDKWELVGGAPAYAKIDTDETTTTTVTWLNLATDGPKITVPRAGVYAARFGSWIIHSAGAGQGYAGVAIGDTTPVLPQAPAQNATAGALTIVAAEAILLGVSAAAAIKVRYYNATAGTFHATQRWISVVPVRVS